VRDTKPKKVFHIFRKELRQGAEDSPLASAQRGETAALNGIEKRFPANAVQALSGADFSLRLGEIHALVGENGAGKSTLMHILAGYHQPDRGSILVDGKPRRFSSPAAALKAGIGMVRQHPLLVPGFRLWEACILGAENGFFVSRSAARKRVAGFIKEWGFDIPLDTPCDALSVGQRQMAAVLSLLLRDVRIFIFDEVTAVLTQVETDRLFALFSRLKSQGRAIALISHKLDETLAIADRVTVIRAGKTAAARSASALDHKTLNAMMFEPVEPQPGAARKLAEAEAPVASTVESKQSPPITPPLLSITHLFIEPSDKPFLRDIEMAAFPGRITGIAGVRDSGLETLELAITGFLKPKTGTITLGGCDITGRGPLRFRKAGGAYMAADRTGTCLAINLPIGDSLAVHRVVRGGFFVDKPFWGRPRGNETKTAQSATAASPQDIISRTGITRSAMERAGAFSGGQLQRLVLEREFAENAKLLVLSEPGWGLDAKARAELAARLRAFAAADSAVILFSSDVDELLALSAEIFVLQNGGISAKLVLANHGETALKAGKAEIIQAMTSAAPFSLSGT
jgi:simple sugar transport system ATP-binding protein